MHPREPVPPSSSVFSQFVRGSVFRVFVIYLYIYFVHFPFFLVVFAIVNYNPLNSYQHWLKFYKAWDRLKFIFESIKLTNKF